MEKFLKQHYKIIVATILSVFFAISALNAYNDSATFDEVAHIPAAYSYVTEHDTRLNPEHPPLIKDLAGIPLLFLDLKFDTGQPFWQGALDNMWDEGQWAAGRHLLYEAGNNPDSIIFWSRIPIILLSVILGLFLFKWGKEIAGIFGGLLVLILYVCDPNILGHNHYVTTDLGVAAFLTFSFYYFLRFIKHPSWKHASVAGVFLGLLLVSKFSSIVAVAIYGLVLIIYPLIKRISHDDKINRSALHRFHVVLDYFVKSIVAGVVAIVVIWAVYWVNDYRMPQETFAKTIDFFFSAQDDNIKARITNETLHTLNNNDVTRPLAGYLFGPAWMFKRVSGGNGAYFLGQVGNGFTWYFPVVFVIKETISFLILAAFALGYTLWRTLAACKKGIHRSLLHWARTSVVSYTLFGFIVVYAYVSISGGLNIGFRHLFPMLPFAYLLITKQVTDIIARSKTATRNQLLIILSVLLLWLVLEPLTNYPGYVSYFNETIGGSKNGYHYVTDSNTDWGQDLKRLKAYLDQHPQIDQIRVDYFGGGNPQQVLGDKYIPWQDSQRPIQPGWYAISANYLQGSIYDSRRSQQENYAWTLELQPITMIENSILVYYVSIEDIQRLRQ